MTQFVALLRGINVGGKNVVKMAELRLCLEALGLRDVATYIQSGNVLFTAPAARPAALARRIEAAIAETFAHRSSAALRTLAQLEAVVAGAPAGFGSRPDRHRYDVIFLLEPLTAATAMRSVLLTPGVDEAHAGRGVLYFSRLTREATRSKLARLVSLPVYQHMTIRNWNTTTRLLAMLRARAAP